MLRQRILTAVILAVVFVGSVLFGNSLWPDWVRAMFSLVLFAAVWEMSGLTLRPGAIPTLILASLFVALFWWSSLGLPAEFVQWQSVFGLCVWLTVACLMPLYRHHGNWPQPVWILLLGLGLALLWICVHGLVYLQGFDQSGWILLYLLSLVWIADIGAYFSGRRFGKNKLAPAISPGKTWEGVIGGMLANFLWMLLVHWISGGWGLPLLAFIVIGFVSAAISIVGDLFISILKREAGVKDSGKLLPGHGGILDRIDSIIAASPVFVAGLYLASLA